VKNTGSVVGSETVQLYITLPEVGVTTPKLQLKAFAKARNLEPGESTTCVMKLDKYAVSFWNTPHNSWKVKEGVYTVAVGTSSDDLPLTADFEVKDTSSWSGL